MDVKKSTRYYVEFTADKGDTCWLEGGDRYIRFAYGPERTTGMCGHVEVADLPKLRDALTAIIEAMNNG